MMRVGRVSLARCRILWFFCGHRQAWSFANEALIDVELYKEATPPRLPTKCSWTNFVLPEINLKLATCCNGLERTVASIV
ncbi:hypothetical protein C8F01DRAFT_364386 [Mycena amicta]|nr:hypothetical protein C8F01DRAFT_364386 [Mycena amicta]